MTGFWQIVGVIVAVGAAYWIGRGRERAGAETRAVTGTDTLPARHRRTPPRPWTPETKATRWVVPPVDDREPQP